MLQLPEVLEALEDLLVLMLGQEVLRQPDQLVLALVEILHPDLT